MQFYWKPLGGASSEFTIAIAHEGKRIAQNLDACPRLHGFSRKVPPE